MARGRIRSIGWRIKRDWESAELGDLRIAIAIVRTANVTAAYAWALDIWTRCINLRRTVGEWLTVGERAVRVQFKSKHIFRWIGLTVTLEKVCFAACTSAEC